MGNLSEQKLKAGVLAGALRMPASTIRSLIGAGLMLGHRQSPGHPDYSLADVVRVKLLAELRGNYSMDGPRSIAVVNAFRTAIDAAVVQYDLDRENFDPWLFISSRFGSGGNNGFPECEVVNEPDALRAVFERERRSGGGGTAVALKGSIVGARYGVGKVLFGDWEVRD
jgi:hypothetical protein